MFSRICLTFQKSIIFKAKVVSWTEMLTIFRRFWIFLPPTAALKTPSTTSKTCALNSTTPNWPTTNLVRVENVISWIYSLYFAKIQKNNTKRIRTLIFRLAPKWSQNKKGEARISQQLAASKMSIGPTNENFHMKLKSELCSWYIYTREISFVE